MDLFLRLVDVTEPRRVAFRFVLSLILLRKRLLRFIGRRAEQGSDDGAGERWLMRPRGAEEGEPAIEVANPHLSDDDVRELTAQLSEILRGEL